MLKRLTLLSALALGLAAPGFPQTETNLNNFGSAPVFQLTTPTNGQCLSYSSATATWINNACGAGGILFNAITSGTNTTATMLVGTGGSLAASGTGTITATALASSAAINLTKNFSFTGNYLGPSSGVNIYGWTGTMSGTNSTSTPLAGVNALDFAVTSDTYVNTIGNQLVGAVGILHNFGGAFQGSANAMSVNLGLTSPTANTIGTGQYPVATFVGQFNSGDNGTLGTPSGALFGLNPNIRLLNNVTYAQQLVGQETDIAAQGAALTSVSITGTAGQFSATSSIPLLVGQAVNISGTLGGTGSITGYTNPTLYLISATNGTTTFTLTTITGSAIVTTAGTPTGLTYTVGASVSDIIGHQIVQNAANNLPGRRANLGYSVNNGTGAPGFDIEFVDGAYSGFPGVASNGTILGVWPHAQNRPATGVSAGTTGCGVDFAGLCLGGSKTFTTAAFAAPGFKIDGSGNVLNSTAGGVVGIGRDAAGVYNGITITPGVTGTGATIQGAGVDASRNLTINSQGNSNIIFGNGNSGVQFETYDGGDGSPHVNFWEATGSIAGGAPVLQCTGSDANPFCLVKSKGASGGLIFRAGSDGSFFNIQNSAGSTTLFKVNTSTNIITALATTQQQGNLQFTASNTLLASITSPTISSGFGTGASVTHSNGSASFSINIGTGGVASSGVVGMPTASNGWACSVSEVTTPATDNTFQTGSSTNTVTVTNYARTTGIAAAWTASDILQMSCWAN